MTTGNRIVVVTNGNYFARLILEDLFSRSDLTIDRVLLITGDYKGRAGLSALRWLARVTTFPYLMFKISQMAAFRVAEAVSRGARYDVAGLARTNGTPLFSFHSINTESAICCVESATADLIVSVSCPQLVNERVLRSARRGGINIHSSLLPRFAGLAPYFWVLAEGEEITGTTVHFMTPRFDEGNVLGQQSVEVAPADSCFDLFRRLALAGGPLLADAARRALDGDNGTAQSRAGGSYRSHPDFKSYLRLRRKGHRLIRLGDLWRTFSGAWQKR